MDEKVYDYIFCGFGLAACLVMEAFLERGFADCQILIIDQEDETVEKTWCYWENGPGKWDHLLTASWKKAWFINAFQKKECLQSELTYKSIASSTMRRELLLKIEAFPNIQLRKENVTDWSDNGLVAQVQTSTATFKTKKIFNSILKSSSFGTHPVLLQHFEGWFIKARQLPFVEGEMTLMDFSVPQKEATRFMYILPFSETTALVEYTLFSPDLIKKSEYGSEIRSYLKRRGIEDFEIEKTESGIIPMTTFPFWKANTRNILNIGTAGGWTKASTGYTFTNAMKLSKKLTNDLQKGKTDFRHFHKPNRFLWYDRLFIDVLHTNNALGAKLFTNLFTKGNPVTVLRFLKEETHFLEEIRIILTCPKWPFLKAAFRSFVKSN